MKIEVGKPAADYLEKKGVSSWPIWEKERYRNHVGPKQKDTSFRNR